MTTFKQLFGKGRDMETAEVQSAELGRLSRLLDDAQWRLDAALSASRKDAAGYRRKNAANPEGGESFDPAELKAAVADARHILFSAASLSEHLHKRERLPESLTALAAADFGSRLLARMADKS